MSIYLFMYLFISVIIIVIIILMMIIVYMCIYIYIYIYVEVLTRHPRRQVPVTSNRSNFQESYDINMASGDLKDICLDPQPTIFKGF